jgi:hypothetical protein
LRLYSEDPDVTWSGFAECGSSKCGGVLAVEEIKIYRRDSFSDMRTKTENMILESRLLEEWYRNADSGLRILFILGKTTDC